MNFVAEENGGDVLEEPETGGEKEQSPRAREQIVEWGPRHRAWDGVAS